jgi:hypothetical protein
MSVVPVISEAAIVLMTIDTWKPVSCKDAETRFPTRTSTMAVRKCALLSS